MGAGFSFQGSGFRVSVWFGAQVWDLQPICMVCNGMLWYIIFQAEGLGLGLRLGISGLGVDCFRVQVSLGACAVVLHRFGIRRRIYWGYIWIMEKRMEATIQGLGFRRRFRV